MFDSIVELIAKYSEEVNGFPARIINKLYWAMLPKWQQRQVLEKWKDLAKRERCSKLN